MVKGKLDGAVDESSVDQEIRKSYAIIHIAYGKSGGLHLVEPGLMVGRQSGRQNLGKV